MCLLVATANPLHVVCMRLQAMKAVGRKIYHVQLVEDEGEQFLVVANGGKGWMESQSAATLLLLADERHENGGRSVREIS